MGIWPFGTPDGRFEERLRLSKVLMNRHDYPAAASELQAALRLKPADAITEFNLGMALVSAGRAAEGIAGLHAAFNGHVPALERIPWARPHTIGAADLAPLWRAIFAHARGRIRADVAEVAAPLLDDLGW